MGCPLCKEHLPEHKEMLNLLKWLVEWKQVSGEAKKRVEELVAKVSK